MLNGKLGVGELSYCGKVALLKERIFSILLSHKKMS
jgi:hypothetical protein